MKGGIGKLMKQAQQMQANMQKVQEELANTEVHGEAGGGMVRIVMTCRYEIRKVQLEDAVVGDDKEMLEDLIAAALNDAVRKVEETTKEKFAGVAGGMSMPGLNLPF